MPATPCARLAELTRRAECTPDSASRHANTASRYIAIHPFADDAALLARLGMSAASCVAVDAYWAYASDVHLVQLWARRIDVSGRDSGLYARWENNGTYAYNLVAVLDEEPITQAIFDSTLSLFAAKFPLRERSKGLTPL